MVEKKSSALDLITSVLTTDQIAVLKDPSGTPLSKRISLANLKSSLGITIPKGVINGLTLSNNGTDPTNDIDIAAGSAVDGTGAYDLILDSALTKRLDATWAVGTGNGFLDTGVIANDWYHVYLIARSDTGVVDAVASASATAPDMPANYDYKRRIGAFVRVSAAILSFTQWSDEFWYLSPPALDVDVSNLSTTRVDYTLASVPDGLVVKAIANVAIHTASTVHVYISNPSFTDVASSATATPLHSVNGAVASNSRGGMLHLLTNTTAKISARSSGASTTFRVAVLGWIDPRGKF